MIRRIKTIKNKLIALKSMRTIKLVTFIGKLFLRLWGLKSHIGEIKIDTNKETVIVVSHEASATGAPILAFNICKELSKKANVITIVLRNGPLLSDFKSVSIAVLVPYLGVINSQMIKRSLKRLK